MRPGPYPPWAARSVCCWSISAPPTAPTAASMRRYLKEFLSDPRVIENQGLVWRLALNGVILRIRPAPQGARIRQIWNQDKTNPRSRPSPARRPRSSPPHSRRAGRGSWSTGRCATAIPRSRRGSGDLVARGCDRMLVVPLYPQYCRRHHGDGGRKVFACSRRMRFQPALRDRRRLIPTIPPISRRWPPPRNAEIARLDFKPEVILASFHGIPKAYVDKGDPYHTQCCETMRLLRVALGSTKRNSC